MRVVRKVQFCHIVGWSIKSDGGGVLEDVGELGEEAGEDERTSVVVVQSWRSEEAKSRRVNSSTGDISGGRRDGGGRTASEARSQQRPGAAGPASEEALFKVNPRGTRSDKDERATGRERAERLLSDFSRRNVQLAHRNGGGLSVEGPEWWEGYTV
jgi:hypothetical protein